MREYDSTLSDAEIIERVIRGDVDTFECLLERHQTRVFGIVANRVPRRDVEEVAHDAFVRAYTSLARFEGRGDFGAWLSKIAVRACHDYWREIYRRREQPMSDLSEAQLASLARLAADRSNRAHGEDASTHEARSLLAWAMDKLSAEDRAVLELVHIEERPVKEAAELLGWSVVNVKVRAYRSRKKLRAILEKLNAE
ncbi:MAG TPA: RNA polymerase sigma factor [Candidatus Krumholzibacteriaceae bacterium]